MLFVCRANLCRSPMAERLALSMGVAMGLDGGSDGGLDRGPDAASAGTHAAPDLDMPPHAKTVLRELGADPDGFTSRRLDGPLLTGADLVLTATRAERAHCVTLAPAMVARTFTLRQFGRYLQALPPGVTTLADVARIRTRLQPGSPQEDDLPDPFGGPIDGFRDCAATIVRILTLLADRPSRDPG